MSGARASSPPSDALQKASGPVGVRLKALTGPRKMRPIFEIRTHRQTFDLLLDGQPTDPEKAWVSGSANVIRIGEVALDDSEIPLGNESARLTRVEVEVQNRRSGVHWCIVPRAVVHRQTSAAGCPRQPPEAWPACRRRAASCARRALS